MIYKIENLSFSYRKGKSVLYAVSLDVEQGDIVTILGCNGAGKSTLLGCMLGLLTPQEGKVLLMEQNLETMSSREIASVVGYVPQSYTPSFGFSVSDFITMGCATRIGLFSKPGEAEHKATQEAMHTLGIEHLAERNYNDISGGERQKAAVARAIVSNPMVVLFDEPTAHLDYGNQLRVLRLIRSISDRGFAVIMTTHNPEHALLLGGKIALLDNSGRLISGNSASIMKQEQLAMLYETDIRLEYIESLGRTVCLYPNL